MLRGKSIELAAPPDRASLESTSTKRSSPSSFSGRPHHAVQDHASRIERYSGRWRDLREWHDEMRVLRKVSTTISSYHFAHRIRTRCDNSCHNMHPTQRLALASECDDLKPTARTWHDGSTSTLWRRALEKRRRHERSGGDIGLQEGSMV
jgi:hypothetical protein